jgi:hypothetical protein
MFVILDLHRTFILSTSNSCPLSGVNATLKRRSETTTDQGTVLIKIKHKTNQKIRVLQSYSHSLAAEWTVAVISKSTAALSQMVTFFSPETGARPLREIGVI